MTSYLMTIVGLMFAPFLTIYDIFANQLKYQLSNLENEGQSADKQNLCHSTANVRIYIGVFCRILDTVYNQWRPTNRWIPNRRRARGGYTTDRPADGSWLMVTTTRTAAVGTAQYCKKSDGEISLTVISGLDASRVFNSDPSDRRRSNVFGASDRPHALKRAEASVTEVQQVGIRGRSRDSNDRLSTRTNYAEASYSRR